MSHISIECQGCSAQWYATDRVKHERDLKACDEHRTETHHEARVFYMTNDAFLRRNALREKIA